MRAAVKCKVCNNKMKSETILLFKIVLFLDGEIPIGSEGSNVFLMICGHV